MSKFPIVHTVPCLFMQLPRDHVNAYVVELENSVVVVDAALAVPSAQKLRKKAESLGKPLEAVLLTHGHPDHYTGLVEFEDLPRFASQGCLDFAHEEDVVKSPTATHYLGDNYPEVRVFPNEIIKDGDAFTFDGVKFTFYDLGPGESDSDGMWIFEKDGIKHVFIGDTVALNCHCFFRDGFVFEWQKILDRLDKEFDQVNTLLYLGHGISPSGMEAVDWQRGYNKAFVNAVARLEDRSVPVSRETQEIVITEVQKYLPGEATLFLLDYEMDVTLAEMFQE